MNLQTYIQQDRGNATKLAASLEIPLSYLSQMASSDRRISPEKATAIEQLTDGLVTRKDSRPDDYWKIWPDLPAPTPAQEVASHG